MAYSKVSLICGLFAFLVISNGVSASWLDDLVAGIKEDIEEHSHPMVEPQKPSVEMVNSHAPAAAPEMSTYQLSAVDKTYGLDDPIPMGAGGAMNAHDENEKDSNIDSDSSFQPNDTDDDNNETNNADDGDGPLP